MQCPKCRQATLAPVANAAPLGTPGAAPLRCDRCHGLWIRQDAIPALEQEGILRELDAPTEDSEAQDLRAGRCPRGHGLLRRAKVDWDDPYYLERCSTCEGIWLDAGEWNRLSSDHLLHRLDELWSPAFQLHLQEELARERFEKDLRQKLGEELFTDLEELGKRLAGRDYAGQALGYLQEVIRGHASEESYRAYEESLREERERDARRDAATAPASKAPEAAASAEAAEE